MRIAEYLILSPIFESGERRSLPEDIQVTRPLVSATKPLEELSYDEQLSELRYRRAEVAENPASAQGKAANHP